MPNDSRSPPNPSFSAAWRIVVGCASIVGVSTACRGEPQTTANSLFCAAGPPSTVQASYALADAFPALDPFLSPVAMVYPRDDDSTLTVIEQNGLVHSFGNSPSVSETLLVADLTDLVTSPMDFDFESHFETGLLGAAYSPRFATDRTLFLSFTVASDTTPLELVVARFIVSASGQTSAQASEEILRIPQRSVVHQAGTLVFGPDDMLYISVGDDRRDPSAARLDNLYGKLLRIDVLSATPYAIPPDNPFTGAGDRGEIFAFGLRNPWKFSFDSETGELWLGDVGSGEWEEVNRITSGGNYGWPTFEGKNCLVDPSECADPTLIAPLLVYPHERVDISVLSGNSVTGGYVYRGSRIPELVGAFVFGDFATGRIWSLEVGEENAVHSVLVDNVTVASYSGFEQDSNGELWVLDYNSGRIGSLEAASSDTVPVELPSLLSETGCMTADRGRAIEYAVNSPLWSDGASKRRWLSLPKDEVLTSDLDGQLTSPKGAVFVKEFRRDGRLLETRLFLRHTDGSHAGYSYAWNEDQTDAVLVGANEERVIETATGPWRIPTRAECLQCHTAGARFLLGVELAQLDRPTPQGSQLDILVAAGVLGAITEPKPTPLVSPDIDDSAVDIATRARSYLHSNCSGCHRPSAFLSRTAIDFRAHDAKGEPIPLSEMNLCDVSPSTDYQGESSGDLLLVPGFADRSILLQRIRASSSSTHRMPPLGSDRIDPLGVEVTERWIDSVANCD